MLRIAHAGGSEISRWIPMVLSTGTAISSKHKPIALHQTLFKDAALDHPKCGLQPCETVGFGCGVTGLLPCCHHQLFQLAAQRSQQGLLQQGAHQRNTLVPEAITIPPKPSKHSNHEIAKMCFMYGITPSQATYYPYAATNQSPSTIHRLPGHVTDLPLPSCKS